MKLGIIDFGANSLRLLLGEYKDGLWHNEPKQLWSTRLGARNEQGDLTEEAMERSFQALQEMKVCIDQYGAEQVLGIATSAVREASNGKSFMEQAKDVCPMEYRIIDGEEEAQLGFGGALGNDGLPGVHYGMIDIGGGSTEVALGTTEQVYWKRSYLAGAVRMLPMSNEGPQRIWEETTPMWDPLPLEGNFGHMIGVGGTITTLAAIHLGLDTYDVNRVQGHLLTREAIEGIIMQVRYTAMEERGKIAGLPANRSDIIVSGGEILTSFMDAHEIPSIVVSDRDGMEGMQMAYGELL